MHPPAWDERDRPVPHTSGHVHRVRRGQDVHPLAGIRPGRGQPGGLASGQAALHVGPLRVSQPFLVIIDPITGIALNKWLFDENFTSKAAVLALAAIGFAVICVRVVLLTQTAPPTMKADIDNEERQLL